jgi:L-aspartate oxidase
MNVVRSNRPKVGVIKYSEIIVIGSGIAGMFAALRLAPRKVTLLTKTPSLTGGSTAWAQGGIAGAVGLTDSPQEHASDTILAGAGLNVSSAVEVLTTEGADRLNELISMGAPFDRDEKGQIILGREAAHGQRRIVHAGGDSTGHHIHKWLSNIVSKTPSIEVKESAFAWELVVRNNHICGVLVYQYKEGWVFHKAPFVVLATGGSGQLFSATTNPSEATADGLAMAIRAGLKVADLEFVQFHPTALSSSRTSKGLPMPLITEALRGEGATLHNSKGQRFMKDVHPEAELAPRDIVARSIWERLIEGEKVYLDVREVLSQNLNNRFPTVQSICVEAGIDPKTEMIPVAPAAHYHMGGIAADESGRTSLQGLWVCGEVASTGAHGANRLASNSLLEGVVFGHRVAEDIPQKQTYSINNAEVYVPIIPELSKKIALEKLTQGLRKLMYEKVGLRRSASGLELAIASHEKLANEIDDLEARKSQKSPTFVQVRKWGELRNLALVGHLVTIASLKRCESRGAHYRTDFPNLEPRLATRKYFTYEDINTNSDSEGTSFDGTKRESKNAISSYL